MASSKRALSSLTLFLALSLILAASVSACTSCPKPKPKPCPTPAPAKPSPTPSPAAKKCPLNTLKLGACANVLNLVKVVVGADKEPCCKLLDPLADVDAALCLCTALKANVLGNDLNIPIALSILLNACSKVQPEGFKCP